MAMQFPRVCNRHGSALVCQPLPNICQDRMLTIYTFSILLVAMHVVALHLVVQHTMRRRMGIRVGA